MAKDKKKAPKRQSAESVKLKNENYHEQLRVLMSNWSSCRSG